MEVEWKDIALGVLAILISVLSYAYIRDLKTLKSGQDKIVNDMEKIETSQKDFEEKNLESHEKIHEKINRIDKEQTETKTIVSRCKNCRGDS